MQQKKLVMHLVSETVLEVAPEEWVLVDGYDPAVDLSGQTARGPRGLGVETAVILVLPYLYKFFDAFINRMASQLADASVATIKKWLSSQGADCDSDVRVMIAEELTRVGVPEQDVEKLIGRIAEVLLKNGKAIYGSSTG